MSEVILVAQDLGTHVDGSTEEVALSCSVPGIAFSSRRDK